ncbi:hypothetical protein HanIR_Chr15g0744131 [Helianthus annuus]|nr:hypothetical protein HanIR_Chr15g0744131 [Helianthus annuus]
MISSFTLNNDMKIIPSLSCAWLLFIDQLQKQNNNNNVTMTCTSCIKSCVLVFICYEDSKYQQDALCERQCNENE